MPMNVFNSYSQLLIQRQPNPEWSFENGLLSGLKLYYPSRKDECEGVEFVTKVNDILDAL